VVQQNIKILQISDIHFQRLPKGHDDYWRLREQMISQMKIFIAQGGHIDYLFICGDIAFKADIEEYKISRSFIDDICNAIGCDSKDVFMVPGNHDSDRNITDLDKTLVIHTKLLFESRPDDYLNSILQKEPDTLSHIFEAFKAYDTFSSLYGCNEATAHEVITTKKHDIAVEPELYWAKTLNKSLDGCEIKVYGVNTALTSDRYDYNGSQGHRLFLPKMAYNIAMNSEDHINILLAHHPFDFLLNNAIIKKNLERYYQLQFFGHVHLPDSDNESGQVHIYSGALQPPTDNKEGKDNKYIPVYNLVTLTRYDTDGYKAINVKLEIFKWIFDDDKFERDSPENYIIKLTGDKKILQADNKISSSEKHDIYRKYIHRRDRQNIINHLIPGLFNDKESFKSNDDKFIEEVTEKKLWKELSNFLK